MKKMHVKTGDTVVVLSGADRLMRNEDGTVSPRIGKVIAVSPEEGKVIVEGVHVVSKHTRARRQGDTSSIIRTEGAIYASKVQLWCPTCKAGVRSKARFDVDKNGNKVKVRVCGKCGNEI